MSLLETCLLKVRYFFFFAAFFVAFFFVAFFLAAFFFAMCTHPL